MQQWLCSRVPPKLVSMPCLLSVVGLRFPPSHSQAHAHPPRHSILNHAISSQPITPVALDLTQPRHSQAPKAKHATVALFTAAGTRGCPHPNATLSCSCSALRSRMAAAGLQWDTPLDRGGAAVAASATAARGSNAGGLSRARSGGSVGGGVRLDEDEPQAAASAGMVREGKSRNVHTSRLFPC